MKKNNIKCSLAFLGLATSLTLTGCGAKEEPKMEQESIVGLEEALSDDTAFIYVKDAAKEVIREIKDKRYEYEAYQSILGERLNTVRIDVVKNLDKDNYYLEFLTEDGSSFYSVRMENLEEICSSLSWLNYTKCNSINLLNCDDAEILNIFPNKEKITSLYFKNCSIEDIDGVQTFPNLQDLSIENCMNITSLQPLSNLNNLENLAVIGTNIVDVTPIKNLNNLKYLDLRYNFISDIEPLYHLENLETINLHGNEIRDEEAFKPFVERGLITDYSEALEIATNREYDNRLYDLLITEESRIDEEEFETIVIHKLDNKDAYYICIIDNGKVVSYGLIDNLNDDVYLYNHSYKKITIENCPDLRVLKNFKKPEEVTKITCISNDNSSLDGIERFTNLEIFHSDTCINLTNLDALQQLNNLQSIIIRGSRISNLSALSNLTNLRELVLINNYISDISPIVDLPSLEYFDVTGNYIIDSTKVTELEENGIDTNESANRQSSWFKRKVKEF